MTEPKARTFFYGSYMNLGVLRDLDFVPDWWEVAKLSGFDIKIQPRANLIRSDQHCVYGVLTAASHQELGRLYAHAQDVLGERYLPEGVLVETTDGKFLPALCYLCSDMEPRPAANDYIDRIALAAREHGFPEWYVKRIEGFRP